MMAPILAGRFEVIKVARVILSRVRERMRARLWPLYYFHSSVSGKLRVVAGAILRDELRANARTKSNVK